MTDLQLPRRSVLFILPSLARSGAESQVLDLIETLDDALWRKHLITFEAGLDQTRRLQGLDVQVHHLRRRRRIDPGLARQMAQIIDEAHVDLIHATLNIAVLHGWMARTFSVRPPPIIAAVHTTISRSRRDELVNRILYQPLLRRCDGVLFVSHNQRAHWLRRVPALAQSSTVIHNGINLDRYTRGAYSWPEQLAPPPDTGEVVVCVAAFRPEKGHRVLLEAWSGVLWSHPDAQLYLVGSGPEEESIRRLVALMGLEDHVCFTGSLEDVRPLLSVASIAVLASTAVETFSLAALEAMAMEVPVVVTDIGGMAEVVDHGRTGLVVPPGNPEALATALRGLLADRSCRDRMALNARLRVVTEFDRRVMASSTETWMNKLLEGEALCHEA